ncbi:MAG TPA: BatA domain-containing protein [Mucilaginibacter sp.]|nr:BatA domain-containing protein [Mucilaginibacter sp.]
MILLNSIWLFALAALSIPVAIHLWNIRPGKTLKVGSIALMNASAQKSSRSFKLHDLLLLLLRCLLLALLALILAMPFWQKHISASSIKGWLLIPKENVKEGYQKFKPQVDSLMKAGYEFHYFNKWFEKAELSKVLTDNKDQKSIADSASYWSLVQRLDGQIPSTLPAYLFTQNGFNHFQGTKPQVKLKLHWQTYTSADSTSTWIEKAWLSNNNDIQVVQGTSKPGGTNFTTYTVRSGNLYNTPFVINTTNGKLTVSLKNSNEAVVVDTSTWRFAVYADRNADAGYVKAVLVSIIQFSKHKAVVKQYADFGQIPAKQSWLFWLSQKPLSKQLSQNADHVFAYETGKINDVNSWIDDNNGSLSSQKIALYKVVSANDNNGKILWQDGFGNPLLSFGSQQHIYHFFSRFDPAYNDLVWNDNFPKMLLKLVISPPGIEMKHDRRTVDTKQLLPVINSEVHTPANSITERVNLARYGWLLLILIFVAERWLAHKKASQMRGKKIVQHG